MKIKLQFTIALLLLNVGLASGQNFEFEYSLPGNGQLSGKSVSMSGDGTRVIIGRPGDDFNATNAGEVTILQLDGNGDWVSLGASGPLGAAGQISGTNENGEFGLSVSISNDGTRIAVGGKEANGNRGLVKVFELNGSNQWVQLGFDFDLDGVQSSERFGTSISLNNDGTRLAIGIPFRDNGADLAAGSVEVYELNASNRFVQVGNSIAGQAFFDLFGSSVSISGDGTRIVAGARLNDGVNGSDSGNARVFELIGGTWTQIGADLDGENGTDQFGTSVSISNDGTRIAVGAPDNDGNGNESGHVRVFELSGGNWVQVGTDIDGQVALDESGTSVFLNSDGSRVLIGGPRNGSGYASLYELNASNQWNQFGNNVDAEASSGGKAGTSVSLSNDGNRIIVGAPEDNSTSGRFSIYTAPNRYDGTGNWSTTGNWSLGTVPVNTNNVLIAGDVTVDVTDAITNDLNIDGSLTVGPGNALTISGDLANNGTFSMSSGSSTIVNGTSTGDVSYTRNLPTSNWYLVSSPVIGETIEDYISNHTSLATGSADPSHRGFGYYINDGTGFNYYTNASTGTIAQGKGYATKFTSTNQDITFTGAFPTSNTSYTILRAQGGLPNNFENSYNLVGNPYPSYVAINNNANATDNLFLQNTTLRLRELTVWFWDGTANGGAGSYTIVNQASPARYVSPGQGFFVNVAEQITVSTEFEVTEAMQSHQSTEIFSRGTTTRPEIELSLTNGTKTSTSDIYYFSEATTDFDNGYDSSIFSGVSNDLIVYTHSVSNSQGRNLGIQSLPDFNYESMVIPVGVTANSGTDITFSANVSNLPAGINLYLEDKMTNIFTRLDETNAQYTITPNSNLDGIGRFYLHTSSQALSTDTFLVSNVGIYLYGDKNLRISGIYDEKAHVELYTILGTQVLKNSFEGTGVNDIDLPSSLHAGIYIVKVNTSKGKLTKKIIIN